jgi:hypothetical protein
VCLPVPSRAKVLKSAVAWDCYWVSFRCKLLKMKLFIFVSMRKNFVYLKVSLSKSFVSFLHKKLHAYYPSRGSAKIQIWFKSVLTDVENL